jgi:uracil-DNA glycosylase
MLNKQDLLYAINNEWLEILDTPYLDIVIDDLNALSNPKFCPPPSKFFEFARIILNPTNINVVIVGMDPYPTQGDAHGLAFSSLSKHIPKSLINIYTAIVNNGYNINKPYTANLTNWAKQGVLLINAALSTEETHAGAHLHIWKNYTDVILTRISNLNDNMIWLLWGNPAQKCSSIINKNNKILTWRHPSPTAQMNCANELKFKNCDHFKKVNNLLQKYNKKEIEWDPNTDNTSRNAKVSSISMAKSGNQTVEDQLELIFNMWKCKNFFNCSSKKHIIFTDGGCYPNDTSKNPTGGYSAIFACGPAYKTVIYGNLKKSVPPSNIRAEGMALLRVLKYLISKADGWKEALIILDCQFWIDMIANYMPKWSKSTFKEKANPDLTISIWKAWNVLKPIKTVSLLHTRSHNKANGKTKEKDSKERYIYEFNDCVDKIATYARLNLKPGTYIIHQII